MLVKVFEDLLTLVLLVVPNLNVTLRKLLILRDVLSRYLLVIQSYDVRLSTTSLVLH